MPDYLELAREAQGWTWRNLAYLDGAAECAGARFVSYRRSDQEPQWADQWYLTTQIGADAALLATDPSFDPCSIEKGAAFFDRLADRGRGGGYLARGTPDCRTVLRPDKYCDDHGHAGLMLLDAYAVTGDRRHLERARRAAEFLLHGRVWDDLFGGGFWWNNGRGDTTEGKPAQTNGLAVDLFAQLYGLTGEARYREKALETLRWLDQTLFDPEAGLYRWSVHFEDLDRRRGRVLAARLFNYDQGIIIEALLSLYRHVRSDPEYLERARAMAGRLEAVFWQAGPGGFVLEAGQAQVFAIYGAWLTPSLLELYRLDPDERWLELARRNVDAMNRYLRAPDGGYYRNAYLADGRWIVDRTRDGAANAGMQRALAMLAANVTGG